MKLEDVRNKIDELDPELRKLLMDRLDCSYEVAKAKCESGDTNIYRADREEEILKKLSEGVPADRVSGYLAVVKKIMETSRMYQYGLLYEWLEDSDVTRGFSYKDTDTHVCVRVSRQDRPNAMSAILSMIGDYGYNMYRMEFVEENKEEHTVTFELDIIGELTSVNMKKLLFQLSKECLTFEILRSY